MARNSHLRPSEQDVESGDVDDLDVVSVLRESVTDPDRRRILKQKFTDVYLVFDMDPHDPRYDKGLDLSRCSHAGGSHSGRGGTSPGPVRSPAASAKSPNLQTRYIGTRVYSPSPPMRGFLLQTTKDAFGAYLEQ